MNIHEYLKEHGFEMTGDFREVDKGEYYMTTGSEIITTWRPSYKSAGKYLILRKLPRNFEFDGQTFREPEGYVFERVGIIQKKDICKYVASIPESQHHWKITSEMLEAGIVCPYFIFRKENE